MTESRVDLAEFFETMKSPIQFLPDPFPTQVNIQLYLKRDDLLHPMVSGNKFRKLKYNLLAASAQGIDRLVTFGGAYSNHLHATAAAGKLFGFETLCFVRGQDHAHRLTPTLNFAQECGMKLHFLTRADYRRRNDPDFLAELLLQNPGYFVPEGGTNTLAVRGVSEIAQEINTQLGFWPNHVVTPVGTGGTLAGLSVGVGVYSSVLGVCVLKNGNYLEHEIKALLRETEPLHDSNFEILWDFHHNGYAKHTPELRKFMADFEQRNGILIEQVYTAKMLWAIYNLAQNQCFAPNANVVALHTGGLQGRKVF